MKKLLLLLLLCCPITLLMAQTTTTKESKINIRGTVFEHSTLKPLQYAAAHLYEGDSVRYVKGDVTMSDGQYTLKDVAPGQYTLRISFIGYETQKFALDLTKRSGNFRAKDVLLKESAIAMQAAVITAVIPEMEVVEDTVVYNTAAFTVPAGSMIEELIKKLPGIDTDDDGKLTVNGKTVNKILVDGKQFFGNDQDMALKNIPSDIVEKVKTYERQSDLARITGIDDGSEETVLDLTIKKGMKQGWFGNVDVSYGTEDRYSEKLSANRFADSKQFSVIASANNVNDAGFPGGGGGFRGGRSGGGNGQTSREIVGFNFALETSKIETGGSVQFNHSNTESQTWTNSQSFEAARAAYSNRYAESENNSTGFSFDYRLEWKPDSMTNILFTPTFSYNKSNSNSNNYSATFNDDPYAVDGVIDPLYDTDLLRHIAINRNTNASGSNTKSLSGNATLQINRKLNNMGRNLTFNFGAGVGENQNNSEDYAQIDYYQLVAATGDDSIYHKIQYNDSPRRNHNFNARISYSEPIFNNMFLQFSYNFSYRYQDQDRTVASIFDPEVTNLGITPDNYFLYFNEAELDLEQCRYVENIYYNHDIRTQLRVVRTKYNLSFGANVQPQTSRTIYSKGGRDFDISRSVVNASPTADFRYRFSRTEQLRFRYNGNSSQPSITDLIPDTLENANPLNIRLGNPELKPSFTHNISAEYNRSNRELQRSINGRLSLRATQNSVSSMTEYNEETGGRVSRPENINGNWNASGNFGFNTALADTRFRISTTTTANYTNSVGYVYQTEDQATTKRQTKATNLSERLRGTYRTDNVEVSLNGSIRYNHSRNNTTAASNLDTYTFSYGASTNIYFPYDISLSTDISQNSRRGYSDRQMNTNELIWNAQIAKRFLKNNAATVSIQFYDILQQLNNISRNISATSRTDTRYNTINSYCMVHFIYRLNRFGGRNANRGAGQQRERGGDFDGGRSGGFGEGERGGFGGGGGGRGGF